MTQDMERQLLGLISNMNDLLVALEAPARTCSVDPAIAFTHVPARDSREEHVLILYRSGKMDLIAESGNRSGI